MRLHLSRPGRATAAALLGGALLVGSATAASAHVTVHPDTTAPGSWAELTFRVPDESATASTTRLVVTLPQDAPLASVSTKPVNGWTATVREDKLPEPVKQDGGATLTKAPHVVTWTAQHGAGIKPGQYQEFSISAGPLPKHGTVSLPATQYYSDGTVVKWNEHATGSTEPEHPAPAFTIGGNGTASAAGDPATTQTSAPSDTTSRWLSGAALAVALVALGMGGTAFARGRRRATPARVEERSRA